MLSKSRKVAPIAGAWRVYLARGARALRDGRLERATQELERALALAPDAPGVLRTLGRALVARGEGERAAELLARAVALQPGSVGAVAALARLLGLTLGRPAEALDVLQQAETAQSAAIFQLVRGEILLETRDLDGAEQAFRMALQQHRSAAARAGLARALNARGMRQSDEGQLRAAADAFREAARLDPRWSAPCVNLGVVLGRAGALDAALDAYARALERDPNNPAAHFNLASVQHESGQLESAARLAERLLQICPDYPQARLALANVLVDLGQFDRAVSLLLQELEQHGDSVQVWSSLGLAYVCAGSVDHGENCLRRALTIDETHFNAYYNLALLYATQGRKGEAEDVLHQALRVAPDRAAGALGRAPPRTSPRALGDLMWTLEGALE